ncbi:MAG: Uma2 family endonuclease [Planctomycetes bacterium]|nr:Uma2 family endonuclease [Planctomycetota bacterium]
MSIAEIPTSGLEFFPVSVQLAPAVPMTQDQFFHFCQLNPDKRFERTADGELIIMAPSSGDAGFQDTEVVTQLNVWAKAAGKGKVMGPSGGFILPNGANRAPDAAWLSPDQLATLTPEQRKKFLPLCPYFLIEVKSPSDSLKKLQEKMEEYLANGCQLGWLIVPETRQVHVYRTGQSPVVLDSPRTVSGEPEMPGFVLDLEPVWNP